MASDAPPPAPGWTLRAKLRLGFGGLLLILLAVSGLSVAVLTHYSRAFERVLHENYDSVIFCDRMREALEGLNVEAQALLADPDGNPDDAAVARWQQQFELALARQHDNSMLPGEAQATDDLLRAWGEYRAAFGAFVTAKADDARRTAYRRELLPRLRAMLDVLRHITAINLRNMGDVDGRVRESLAAIRGLSILLAGAGAVLGVVFIAAVAPAMLRSLSALTRSARRIADGQLDDPALPVRADDEVGQLARAFNQMAARLREFRRLDLERLERTRQTTQMAIDSLPDAIAVLNPSGHVELVNRTGRERFGWGAREAPTWMAALHEQVMRSGQAVEPQGYKSAIQQFHHGDERFYLPHAAPLTAEDDGRVVGVTVILSDVTNLKHADEAKGDLVSTVSHELKTPLTSIRMAVHMLGDQETFGGLSDRQIEILRTARDNTERLFRTVEHLLSIDRLQSGRVPLKLADVPAARLIDQALDPMMLNFAARDIRVTRDVNCGAERLVRVDPDVITYVLTNLLTNALKYAPPKTDVRVRCQADGSAVRFTVEDDGPGIPAEHLPHLFERFFRAPVGPAAPGAGLGLAIAREIVEAHGGTIAARNRDDGRSGAIFAFTLPLSPLPTEY